MCYIISSMQKNITKHIKPLRLDGLPEDMQRELGSRLGLPQMHISGIESGKIVPRYDTLLELVRILDRDLLMVPRALVPAVQSLIRDHLRHDQQGESDERPLYGDADDEQKTPERKDEV